MLKLRNSCNGAESLNFIHGYFRHFILYSTSSSSTSVSVESNNPNFTNYLVDFLGFPTQQALSTSSKLVRYRLSKGAKKVNEFNFVKNADSVVQFLKKIGLQQSHIRNTIFAAPRILLCNVDKTLMPKKDIFIDMGFSDSDFVDVVNSNPFFFFGSMNNAFVPAVQALRDVMGCDSHVIAILKKSHQKRFSGLAKYLVPNVALLQNYGIPIQSIRKFVYTSPSCICGKTDFFEDVLIRVEQKLDIPRASPQFLIGISLLVSFKEKNIHSKREMFKSFGWTDSDVLLLFTKMPICFALSAATIKKKLGFLMNELGYQPKFIISCSSFLSYSLEKRIVPRHKLILVLKEKGLISPHFGLQSVVTLSESRFLEKFVIPFEEVHELYSKLAGLSMDVLTQISLEKKSCTT